MAMGAPNCIHQLLTGMIVDPVVIRLLSAMPFMDNKLLTVMMVDPLGMRRLTEVA